MDTVGEGEVGDVVRQGLDVVERQLALTDLTAVCVVVTEVPSPVGRVPIHPRSVDFELLISKLDQPEWTDRDS